MKRETENGKRKAGGAAVRIYKPLHYELDVWQEAMRLARDIYRDTQSFPAAERFGLSLQLRRGAVSVASNIAEGAARGSRAEFVRFLLIARGALMEIDTQLWLARDLGLLEAKEQHRPQIESLFAKLNGLIRAKRARTA